MESNVRANIKKDFQIKKFCAYGFLKNLKFFEPYLIIYLMSHHMNLTQIGFLVAIREVMVNLFEIPSGIIADYFGRKKEMYFCFSFYIVSFVFFFLSRDFWTAVLGMVFFGLGEAFRSGTHKAMIYTYLEEKGWQKEKTFVYGRTRSFSLIGSAVSSIAGIILILNVPSDNYIFLFSTLPYVLDLLLIVSYPNSLNASGEKNDISFKGMFLKVGHMLKERKALRSLLLEEGMAEATVSYVKDLIQPMMEVIIISSGIMLIQTTPDDNLKIILGIVYAILNLTGSFFSKKAYLLRNKFSQRQCLKMFHISFGIFFAVLACFWKNYWVVCFIYLGVYIVHSMRKPVFVDEIDNLIDKTTRATFLSISSQVKSVLLMIFAPILGFVADTYGIGYAMVILAVIFLSTVGLLKKQKVITEY